MKTILQYINAFIINSSKLNGNYFIYRKRFEDGTRDYRTNKIV